MNDILSARQNRYPETRQQSQIRLDRETEQAQQTPSGDLWGAAVESEMVHKTLARMSRLQTKEYHSDDPDFRVGQAHADQIKSVLGITSEREFKFISSANSEDSLVDRINYVKEERGREDLLNRNGMSGLGYRLGAAVLDPIGLGIGIATGGVGWVAKGGRMARIMKGGALTGAESAALEAVLVQGSTQRDAGDIILAGLVGAAVGGGISGIGRGLPEAAETSLRRAETAQANRTKHPETRAPEAVKVAHEDLTGKFPAYTKKGLDLLSKRVLDDGERLMRDGLDPFDDPDHMELRRQRAEAEASYEKVAVAEIVGKDITPDQYDKLIRKPVTQEQADAQVALLKSAGSQELGVKPRLRLRAPDESDPAKAADEAGSEASESSKSAGAMEDTESDFGQMFDREVTVEEAFQDAFDDMEDTIRSGPVTTRYIPRAIRSLFATLDNSENWKLRVMGRWLLENPQGGESAKTSAAVLAHMYQNRIRSKLRNAPNRAFLAWAKERGVGGTRAFLDSGNLRKEYDNEVIAHLTGVQKSDNPHISEAAERLADAFEESLSILRDAGVRGFENVTPNREFFPDLYNGERMQTSSEIHGENKVVRVLAEGIKNSKKFSAEGIDDDIAETVARTIFKRSVGRSLGGGQGVVQEMSSANAQKLAKRMREKGSSDESIQEVLDYLTEAQESLQVTNRAMERMGIDRSASIDGLQVSDLLENNLDQVFERYVREMSGLSAFARKGMRSRRQVEEFILSAEKDGIELGYKDTDKDIQDLRDAVKMIMGETLEVDDGTGRFLRRLRSTTGLVRLQQMGFASIPEAGRVIAHIGLVSTMRAVPGLGMIRRSAARVDGQSGGVHSQADMEELEEVMGFVGEDTWLKSFSTRDDDWSLSEKQTWADKFDRYLEKGHYVQNFTSLFQYTQGGMEKLASRGISRKMVNHLTGKSKAPAHVLKLWEESGLDSETVSKLQKHLSDNKKTAEVGGREIQLWNMEAMDIDLRETLTASIVRLTGRTMQKNFVGETSMALNRPLGKLLGQLRSFVIVSLEKQLLHDARNHRAFMAIAALQTTALAAAAHYAQVSANASLLSGSDRRKYLREELEDQGLLDGIIQKAPYAAAPMFVYEAALTAGVPDVLGQEYSPNENRGSARDWSNIANAVPALGYSTDVLQALQTLADGEDFEERADAFRRVIPGGNLVGLGKAMKIASD